MYVKVSRVNAYIDRFYSDPAPILEKEVFNPIKLHDAVRIIAADHRYLGYTGLVVRVDEEYNLYEILLDKLQIVVYVTPNMAALGLQMHEPALHRIERFPALHLRSGGRSFPIEIPTTSYSKALIRAALKIQRYLRMF